ncbi:DUF309 domain-containing protein [Polycladomyces subterraneus]|uniref:DUF309 domain-containing protein n=1 Tax=Polycladomyces subterraneus TaxID=1016997 RepID=A0ABT8IMK5_9BACL|nr:DUF309 domain-containing protein [Polycladomyces subterraneus]MDN4594018.1 DUF309 domain-containing protein [Polycladomyces subterraneus]
MSHKNQGGEYPELYVRFLRLFNLDRDYYTCHDVMEELWLEEGRDLFYQGLLQTAVGLHHYRNQNKGGAVKLMTAALNKLVCYPDVFMGIDVAKLKQDVEAYLDKLQDRARQSIPYYDLTIEILDPILKRLVHEDKG